MNFFRLMVIFSILGLSACTALGPSPKPIITANPSATPSIPAPVLRPTIVKGPDGLRIELYPLKAKPHLEPLQFSPALGTQDAILNLHQDLRQLWTPSKLAEINQQLRPFGYQLELTPSSASEGKHFQLIQGNSQVLKDQQILSISPLFLKPQGTGFLLVIGTMDGDYLVSEHGISKWDKLLPPVLLGNDLLSVDVKYTDNTGLNGQIQVSQGDKPIFQAAFDQTKALNAFQGLWSNGNHWVIEIARANPNNPDSQILGDIYTDGQSLNQRYGYQQTFGYDTLQGKPYFFYQKGNQLGISYAGIEIPLGLDEIPHYGCCSAADLNPSLHESLVEFFARKESTWYYAAVYLQSRN